MDDEEVIRDVAGKMLERIGYEAGFARDGGEAIETYKKAMESGHPFDAVIMDLTIPGGMGGKEAIKKLKEIDPTVKAIVSSGYSDDEVMAEFREYGFIGAVAKPYKIVELKDILQKIVRVKKARLKDY
jgi:CheY-like chemotaxis protein